MRRTTKLLIIVLACCLGGAWCQTGSGTHELSIASFNIQVFGVTKLGNAEVARSLVQILNRFDLTAIMEIRDASGTAFPRLVEMLNGARTDGRHFESVVGPRVGRSSSKEQYALLYLSDRFIVRDWYSYADTQNTFERPPLVAHVTALNSVGQAGLDFIAIVIHTKPLASATYLEINGLQRVFEEAKGQFGVTSGVIMGDFNAECDYVPRSRWADVTLRTSNQFRWLVDDAVDTTTGPTTDCAYDRVVLTGQVASPSLVEQSFVFDFQQQLGLTTEQTRAVSDHYPVYFNLVLPKSSANESSAPAQETNNNQAASSHHSSSLDPTNIAAIVIGTLSIVAIAVWMGVRKCTAAEFQTLD